MKAVDQLAHSFRKMNAEQARAGELTRKAFPIGSEVYWAHGDRLRYAEVIEHSTYGGLKVRVRGWYGKEYWIDAYKLVSEMSEVIF